jgi:hypothetical protein
MQKQDYDHLMTEINMKHQREISLLRLKYCRALASKYEIGDMITDHIGTIKFEGHGRISTALHGYPEPTYVGKCYTKKGEPFKSGEMRTIYHSNIGK